MEIRPVRRFVLPCSDRIVQSSRLRTQSGIPLQPGLWPGGPDTGRGLARALKGLGRPGGSVRPVSIQKLVF